MPNPTMDALVEALKSPLAEWESTLLAYHYRKMVAAGDPYALDHIIEMSMRRRVTVARAALTDYVKRLEAERDEALAAMSADVADVVLSNAALRYELKQAQADYDTLLGEVIALRASVSFRAEGEEYEVQHGPIISQVGLTFLRLPDTYIGDRVTVRKVE